MYYCTGWCSRGPRRTLPARPAAVPVTWWLPRGQPLPRVAQVRLCHITMVPVGVEVGVEVEVEVPVEAADRWQSPFHLALFVFCHIGASWAMGANGGSTLGKKTLKWQTKHARKFRV